MQFFIILAVTVGCALADGRTQYLSDSPDVASAKLAHFEAKAKAAAAVGAAPDYVTSYYLNYYKNLNAPAAITVLPNGFLADTPEVSAAKASFNAEFAKATAAAAANPEYSNDYYNYYFKSSNANQYNANANQYNANANNANTNNANQNNANPNYYIPANIVVQSNGYLADTPEVSAAKASFNAEFAKLTAAAAANPEYSNDYYNYYYKSSNANNANQYNANTNNANQNNANQNNANPNYYIPANIVVQSNGYLADTPEVSAAKASFNAEFAKATAAAAANPEYSNDYYNYYYKSSNANQYNANANNANQYNANANNANQYNANANNANQNNANPNNYIPANIVVQSNGYLADTPEVSAAKASFNAEFAKATAAAAANPEYSNDYYNYYFKSSNANQYNANANNANQYNANANNANQYNANANNADQNKANPNYYTPANIVVQPDGYLADTPEVAAAKASHNTEVALATAAAATNQENSNNYNYYYKSYNNANNNQYNNANQEAANPNYYIPANIVLQSNGYLADTPEVAAAKASHNAEFAKAAAAAAANPDYSDNYYNNYYANPNNAYSTYNYKAANNNNYYYKYYTNANPNTYIPANIVVQPNGYLADTPEVAAAKAFHNAAFTKAAAAAAVNPDNINYNTQANN